MKIHCDDDYSKTMDKQQFINEERRKFIADQVIYERQHKEFMERFTKLRNERIELQQKNKYIVEQLEQISENYMPNSTQKQKQKQKQKFTNNAKIFTRILNKLFFFC
jgi:hypothetical protein